MLPRFRFSYLPSPLPSRQTDRQAKRCGELACSTRWTVAIPAALTAGLVEGGPLLPPIFVVLDRLDGCMADLIVKSAVKDQLEDKNVAADFYDALDNEVTAVLEKATRRAENNDHKTVQLRSL